MIRFSKFRGVVTAEIGQCWRATGTSRKDASAKLLALVDSVPTDVSPVVLVGPDQPWVFWWHGNGWSYRIGDNGMVWVGQGARGECLAKMLDHFESYYPDDTLPNGTIAKILKLRGRS